MAAHQPNSRKSTLGPGPGPATTTAAPAHKVLFDGSILQHPMPEGSEGTFRRSSTINRDFETNKPSKPIQGRPLASKSMNSHSTDDRPPLTPPRVSGISLAPTDALQQEAHAAAHIYHSHHKGDGAAAARNRRAPLKVAIPSGKHEAAGVAGTRPAPADTAMLVAEGKGLVPEGKTLVRAESGHGAMMLHIYEEINDTDSLCSTPPAVSIEAVTRNIDGYGPLGPLTPTPLSPSLLTICGALDSCSLSGVQAGLSYDAILPDMRQCESPHVASA